MLFLTVEAAETGLIGLEENVNDVFVIVEIVVGGLLNVNQLVKLGSNLDVESIVLVIVLVNVEVVFVISLDVVPDEAVVLVIEQVVDETIEHAVVVVGSVIFEVLNNKEDRVDDVVNESLAVVEVTAEVNFVKVVHWFGVGDTLTGIPMNICCPFTF